MITFKAKVLGAALSVTLLSLLATNSSNAQNTNCSAALPEFAAAMKAGTVDALSAYLDKHAPCLEAPAKAKLKALGGGTEAAETKKPNAQKPADTTEDESEKKLVADTSCQKFANARSERSDEPLLFQIINRSSEKLSVSWINYKGKRQPPADLPPGGKYGGKTFVTHPFEVTRSDKSCVKIIMPKIGVSEYFIGN